jgi:hypothetical protein
MHARWMLVLLLAATAAPVARAQVPWQFRWEKSQVLSYRVKHDTAVAEVIDGQKHAFKSQLELLKRYRVVDVDGDGIATVEYSLAAMRNEQVRPNGEVYRFDSADPAKSTPELRGQLGKYIGTTLAVLRIDRAGKVIAVKQGPAARHMAEPPFTLVLPGSAVREGQAWTRDFEVTLEPPLGTGEKHAAQQEFRCTKLVDGKVAIALKTVFKAMPESVQEQMPLLQKEAQGDVVFDVAAGRVEAVRLTIDRTLMNHQGEGSSYRYQSTYVEELISK